MVFAAVLAVSERRNPNASSWEVKLSLGTLQLEMFSDGAISQSNV